jgi:prepilin-type N-terminal cleavage/methylation domain-containing protein
MISAKNNVHQRYHRQKGLSLLELSIVISVTAILAVGILSWVTPTASTDADKALVTRAKMVTISKAMEAFRVKNDRLPCPADKTLPMRSSQNANNSGLNQYDYDDEALSITATSTAVASIGSNAKCATPIGAVPSRALGLSSDMMLDGWGRKFLYHVNATLCSNSTNGCSARSYSFTPAASTLLVQTTSTAPAGNITSAAAYVLVSYGADGYYAYTPAGTVYPGTGSTDEVVNGNKTANPLTYIQKAVSLGSPRYDDITLYRTKDQLESAVFDTAAPLVDRVTCQANMTAGIAKITAYIASGTAAEPPATSLKRNLTRLRSPLVTGTDISVTAPSTIGSTSTDLSIFPVGTQITTSGFPSTANNNIDAPTYTSGTVVKNNHSMTVTASSSTSLTVDVATLATDPAGQTVTISSAGNGDEAVLGMMWALQDVCNEYYGTFSGTNNGTANDVTVTATDTFTFRSNLPNYALVTFVPGSDIFVSGFVTANNNGIFSVVSRTATTMKVKKGTNLTPLTAETTSVGEIVLISHTCPGNDRWTAVAPGGSPATYSYTTNSCRCPSGTWDGNTC